MNFTDTLHLLENLDGNYTTSTGSLFFSPANMKKLLSLLESSMDIHSILMTPFLIDTKSDLIYELHYYEFAIEVDETPCSYYAEYPVPNCLPTELLHNMKPKAVTAVDDKSFFIRALRDYLSAMENMKFENDRNAVVSLQYAELYFQIY